MQTEESGCCLGSIYFSENSAFSQSIYLDNPISRVRAIPYPTTTHQSCLSILSLHFNTIKWPKLFHPYRLKQSKWNEINSKELHVKILIKSLCNWGFSHKEMTTLDWFKISLHQSNVFQFLRRKKIKRLISYRSSVTFPV